ncbi:murein biosynthesis integral membrane protein MurJ [Nisaea sp.]|uniref:murein biosynthesis integral membrane protein MurJ n=1 Tax=Nisaea sp. TaxID=2024842 RepID=UPI002B2664FB|nr:murein biosynthesis integral membrane protein MurJ [Nisaea sp.]
MSLIRAAATVGSFTMMSRVTGFVRDVLIAAILGAGPVADAFFVAFKLPNFFRRLTAEGSFTVAFVPLFAGTLEADGVAAAKRFASEVLAMMCAVLLALTLAMQLTMPWVMHVMAPGFVATPDRFSLVVELTRITFPYLPLISLVALYGGILNSIDRFAAMAAAPILLNLILIGAMVGFADRLETPGHVLAWGVAAAGLAQLVWLIAAARRDGWTLTLRLPKATPGVRKLFRLMLPAMLGAGVVQINLLIDMVLASTLPLGSISFLYYADRVNQLPLGVIGVAIGTALLPMLSRQWRAGDGTAALETQNRALEFGALLTVPAAVGIGVLATPIITVLFERGAFEAADTAATAAAMIAFAGGLPAFVLVKVLQPGFFAREDTRTPVKVAAAAVVLNLVLNLILMQYLAHVGLALATAIASWMNALMLARLLGRDGAFHLDARSRRRLPRILLCALLMGGCLYGALQLAEQTVPGLFSGAAAGIAGLIALILLAVIVYFGSALITGAMRLSDMRGALRGNRRQS